LAWPKLNQLRTKLTVLYAGLFGLILLLISLAVYSAVTRDAERTVRGELAANGAVFDRIWALRSSQLHDEADVLAHDFGFRAAVATGDTATIRSALENLRQRLGIDAAFVVGLDGRMVATGAPDASLPADVAAAVQGGDQTAGVFIVGAKAYHAACTPDIFLFDRGRRLVYRGQFDASRPGNGIPVTGKDLRVALDAVLAGKPTTEFQVPSIGCNIKWKAGNEPDYF